ncbi:MAG: hypothetical protein JNM14_12640 [Ferruginibacter sp.]|nr:hypothetical protein [Ferruginibacter sp.]
MKLFQKILNKLNGLHYSQEYLCFANNTLPQQLHAYLVQDQQIVQDITHSHLFVGYCPLVFAFSVTGMPGHIEVALSNRVLQPNEKLNPKDALARLQLALIKKQQHEGSYFFYYEGMKGSHQFQSAFRQYIGKIYNNRYNQKPGNVFLHDNLYKQVQIAYAVPRLISLITVGGNDLFNLFPTDLHGPPDETHYIISLRTAGKACRQVMAEGKLLLCQMQGEAYKTVYALGKNHMQEMKTVNNFPFSGLLSENFRLPLPQMAISYNELELIESFVQGIHTILLFKIVNSRQLQQGANTLVHIHNSYATWRYKNGLKGNYLMR